MKSVTDVAIAFSDVNDNGVYICRIMRRLGTRVSMESLMHPFASSFIPQGVL